MDLLPSCVGMRVCMYAPTRTPYGSLYFLLSQVSHLRCKTHRKNQTISRLPSAFSSSWKTTCCFFNTSCCFLQNIVLFFLKHRIVFFKTSYRFIIKSAAFLSCSFGEQNTLVVLTKMHPNFIEKTAFPGC